MKFSSETKEILATPSLTSNVYRGITYNPLYAIRPINTRLSVVEAIVAAILYHKEYIFNGLKLEIINSDPENERLSHRIYTVVHNLDIFIKQESKKINSFTSDIGHERYITDFISLTSDYNNLVAVVIHHGKIYSNKLSISEPIKPVELDNSILQRYNYIINKKLIVAIKEVAKNNPDIYDKDAFGTTYTWDKSIIKEVTLSDLNNIRKDGKVFSTKVEYMTEIVDNANDGISTTLLKKNLINQDIFIQDIFLQLVEIQKILVISKQILEKN